MKKKLPGYERNVKLNFGQKLIRSIFYGPLRRSNGGGMFFTAGIVLLMFSFIFPFGNTGKAFPDYYGYLIFIAGLWSVLSAVLIRLISWKMIESWRKSLPFPLPERYQQYLDSNFSIYMRGIGSSNSLVNIEIIFEKPFSEEQLIDKVIRLGKKGITVESKARHGNENPRSLVISGSCFVSGQAFHVFFRKLCDDILTPLHPGNPVQSIILSLDGERF